MDVKIKKTNWKYLLVYAGVAIFYLWMAAQIPYTHDDWDWGLPVGIQLWIYGIYNGRYVGNFFEVIMTRSELVKTLIMGVGYWLLPFLLVWFAMHEDAASTGKEKKRFLCFLLCNVLLLTMNRRIWQQTYGWVAGYGNFVLSAFLVTVIFRKVLAVFEAGHVPQEGKFSALIWVCVGLVSQLFLENVAALLFVVSVGVLAYSWFQTKRISRVYLGLTLGTTLGLLVMLGSGVYQELWNDGNAVGGFRNVYINSNTDIVSAIVKCFNQAIAMPYFIWEANWVINSVILLLLSGGLLCVSIRNSKKSGYVFAAANVGFLFYFISSGILGLSVRWAVVLLVNAAYFLVVVAETVWLYRGDKAFLSKLLTVWICAPAVLAPLVVTNELGARLFFTSNVFLIMFAAMLFVKVADDIPAPAVKLVHVCIPVAMVCMLMYWGKIYHDIGACKSERDAAISHAIATDADQVSLPRYPHGQYMWIPDPLNKKRLDFFREFYGLAQDVVVKFED